MRRAARADKNQQEVAKALVQMGCSILYLHQVGSGCPDLLVGRAGRNLLLEVKDGEAPPSRRALTRDEERFHCTWAGHKAVVTTVKEAIAEVLKHT